MSNLSSINDNDLAIFTMSEAYDIGMVFRPQNIAAAKLAGVDIDDWVLMKAFKELLDSHPDRIKVIDAHTKQEIDTTSLFND